LRHLAIAPEAQNSGAGRLLVVRLIEMVRHRGCRRLHTIARNTSKAFFRKVGFRTAPGFSPEHPVFKRHGITFELMEMVVEPITEADGANTCVA
jgi:N-acetylglutamate synthase-like GNAT family acetyltransferase